MGKKYAGILIALHDLFFSANIACTFTYALALYVIRSLSTWPPHDDAGYYFFRGAARVSDLTRLGMVNAVTTEAVARRGNFPDRLAVGITLLITVLSIMSLGFLLIRTLRSKIRWRGALERTSWAIALFGTPTACLLVLKATWDWPLEFGSPPMPFHQGLFFSVFVGEIVGLVILRLAARKRPISGWTTAILLVMHFGFWGLFLFPNVVAGSPGYIPFYSLFAPWAALAVFLCLWLVSAVGAAWLLRIAAGDPYAASSRGAIGRPAIIAAALGIGVLLAVWLPGWNRSFRPNDANSVVVELSRGPCFGGCPAYTVTIHGDGSVEYVGKRFANRNRQTGVLGRAQVSSILQNLEQAHFFTLEDRAFSWCFDTPSVSVTVSSDGRSKRVVSDAGCVGPKSEPQERFVRAAQEIDGIVGSERYLKCDGRCR